jgi:CubicO group peptidase (beta-lactamase class C family)
MTGSPLNTSVQNLLERQISEGRQLGVQAAAYQHGKLIVDTWSGTLGPSDPRPVGPDTLFSSFSTTKGVAAAALHILADRGQIEYDVPVAKYWPAFAANGKGNITVAQAMSHQSGLHAVPVPLTADWITNWEAGLDWIANGVPAWEPGTATGYHAITYAWIAGGIIQFATGCHIKDVIQEEIARPLGIEGQMYVGIPAGVEDRLASLKAAPPPPPGTVLPKIPMDHDFFKAMPMKQDFTYNDLRIRQACIPSANGHFTARALARMYGALANGGEIDGARLVSPTRIKDMHRVMTTDTDRVLMMAMNKGIGFFLGGETNGVRGVQGPRITAFGHSGAGGSTAFADPEVGLSIAVTINQMQGTLQAEGPTFEICELIRNELGVNS